MTARGAFCEDLVNNEKILQQEVKYVIELFIKPGGF